MLCTRLSWPFCQLLSVRNYIVSYRKSIKILSFHNTNFLRFLTLRVFSYTFGEWYMKRAGSSV